MRKISVTRALSTGLTALKIGKIADEAGVTACHIETRLVDKAKWLNDFEVTGPPGKVDAFFNRVNDLRND